MIIPLDRLFAVGPEVGRSTTTRSTQGIFYAESWALVHYLMRGNPERTPQLSPLPGAAAAGPAAGRAFREAFQTDYATLLGELVRRTSATSGFLYNRRRVLRARVPDRDARRRRSATRRCCAASEICSSHAGRTGSPDAERYFQAALAAEPADAGALAGLGLAAPARGAQRRGGRTSSERRSRPARADYRAYYDFGAAAAARRSRRRARRRMTEPTSARSHRRGRAALRKSIALNPEFPEARVDARPDLLRASRRTRLDEGIVRSRGSASGCFRRAPTSPADLARLYDRSGEQARRRRAPERPSAPSERAAGRGEVAATRSREVNALLARGKDDEAVGAARRIIVASSKGEDPAELETQRELRKVSPATALREYNRGARALQQAQTTRRRWRRSDKIAAASADPDLAPGRRARRPKQLRALAQEELARQNRRPRRRAAGFRDILSAVTI